MSKPNRLYCFTNFYLSSIQKGIQTAHVIGNMAVKYDDPNDWIELDSEWFKQELLPHPARAFYAWADKHQTIVVLNGGDTFSMINEIEAKLNVLHNPYPWAMFHEEGLENTLTAIAIILPDDKYLPSKRDWYGQGGYDFDDRMFEILRKFNSLAI